MLHIAGPRRRHHWLIELAVDVDSVWRELVQKHRKRHNFQNVLAEMAVAGRLDPIGYAEVVIILPVLAYRRLLSMTGSTRLPLPLPLHRGTALLAQA